MLPNFLVVGAAKSGTTSLYHLLGQLLQIYMSPEKEPEYFSLYKKGAGLHRAWQLAHEWGNNYRYGRIPGPV